MNNMRFAGLGLIVFLVAFIVSSFFLIHLLAAFGIFLAVSYPIWWIFAPDKTVCLLCRAEKDGQKCFFCREPIKKSQGVSPRDLWSALSNSALILVFSFISMSLVFGESKILNLFGFPSAPKTVSFVIPTKGQYRLGEIFPMKVEISGIKVPVNAIQADLGFDPAKLEVIDVRTDESFANIFIQKEINNEGGYIRLTGGLPNPGFFADHGIFGTVLFKGKSPGLAKLEYLPTSMVLANDGKGTNVLKDFASVSYLILPEKISEEEQNLQKSISLGQMSVLGEESDNTQMKFYEENRVLGAKIGQELPTKQQFNFSESFFGNLEKIDLFILAQWSKILSIF